MTNSLVDRLRNEQVEQSSRCGEEDSQDRALLAEEAANEIERLRAALTISRGQWIHSVNAEQCMIALGCEAEWREIEARRSSEPLQQRCDCWERISALIVKGPLEGDGWDPTAQRNGIILAANHIAPFNRPASRDASPADLVGALQDVVHTDPGPVRAGKAYRSEPKVGETFPAFMYCPTCSQLYTGRGGQDGYPMMLTCPNHHTWQDPRPVEGASRDASSPNDPRNCSQCGPHPDESSEQHAARRHTFTGYLYFKP